MTMEYQQVPSQQAFFVASQPELDPWLFSNTNAKMNWNKGHEKHIAHPPPLFDDEGPWSSPSSPIFGSLKKNSTSPTPFLSSLTPQDPWLQDSEDDNSADSGSVDDGSSGDDSSSLYKTELCRSFIETGTCRYGLKCQFAHGGNELRPVHRHPKYKTEICKTFHTQGTCPYGTRCRFIHTRGSSKQVSPSTSPYSSPPMPALRGPSRSPSPPASVPKWTSPHKSPEKKSAEEGEEGDGENESEVPTVPSASESSPPEKKRLAIFRTISKDRLK